MVADDPRLVRAVIGGVYETLYQPSSAAGSSNSPICFPDLLYCVLVPYVGHPAALRERDRELRA